MPSRDITRQLHLAHLLQSFHSMRRVTFYRLRYPHTTSELDFVGPGSKSRKTSESGENCQILVTKEGTVSRPYNFPAIQLHWSMHQPKGYPRHYSHTAQVFMCCEGAARCMSAETRAEDPKCHLSDHHTTTISRPLHRDSSSDAPTHVLSTTLLSCSVYCTADAHDAKQMRFLKQRGLRNVRFFGTYC